MMIECSRAIEGTWLFRISGKTRHQNSGCGRSTDWWRLDDRGCREVDVVPLLGSNLRSIHEPVEIYFVDQKRLMTTDDSQFAITDQFSNPVDRAI
jgi:hypothetical protein